MMVRIKTFATPLKVFKAHGELDAIDAEVNRFLDKNGIDEVMSVSDSITTDSTGAAIGLVRVVTYRVNR